jgi:putative FmdB family regulatory protein
MPTYEYECTKCGEHLEVFLGVNDPQPQHCKKCKGKLQKVFFPVGIVFKGSGFYLTDNRNSGGNGKSGKACKAGKSKTPVAAETPSEPKPVESKPAAPEAPAAPVAGTKPECSTCTSPTCAD